MRDVETPLHVLGARDRAGKSVGLARTWSWLTLLSGRGRGVRRYATYRGAQLLSPHHLLREGPYLSGG